jgi:hypothetical protein
MVSPRSAMEKTSYDRAATLRAARDGEIHDAEAMTGAIRARLAVTGRSSP